MEIVDNWLSREEPPEMKKSTKMKQMEISLKLGVETKPADTSSKSTKLSKEEKLARAAIGWKKMTDWLVAAPGREWDDDPDLPELEAIEEIEEKSK